MIQKMGAQERTEYVADFKAHNEQCKAWLDLFTEFNKASRHHFKEGKGIPARSWISECNPPFQTLPGLIKEGVTFGDCIGSLTESDQDKILGKTLKQVLAYDKSNSLPESTLLKIAEVERQLQFQRDIFVSPPPPTYPRLIYTVFSFRKLAASVLIG